MASSSVQTKTHAEQLIEAARAGSEQALGQLLQLYNNYLSLLARTQIDPKLRARVSPSDVVQETHLEAHRDFPQFTGQCEREFLGWLRQIMVHNLARLIERHVLAGKRDIRREVSLSHMGKAIERSTARLESILAGREESPSNAAVKKERAVELADRLAELPENYRHVLVLRHLEGLPFKEIAEKLDRSEGATRMLWLRAIDRLKSNMQAEEVS